MNKVFNINLGGYPFTIDENAYHHLKQYLGAIDSHFKNSEGFDDITTDIETRLAEIFREKLQGRQIVTLSYVTEAINIMGTPEDFGAESNYTGVPKEEAKRTDNKNTHTKAKGQKFGKRLYRNPDETIVGGVASGISAYFGIEDPIWIRILLAIIIFSGGIGVPLYIILWIALPEAKTAKQKLEMRGEKIDVNNIAKTIEEELLHVKDKINEIGDEFKKGSDKKKRGGKETEDQASSYGNSNTFDDGIAFVRQISGAIEQFVRAVYKPLFYIIGWFFIIILAIVWAALIIGSIVGHEYFQFLVGAAHAPFVSAILFLAIGIPLISIALSVMRTFFRMKIHKGWTIGLVVAGVLSVSGFFAFASIHAGDFKIQEKVSQAVDISAINGDVLELDGVVFENENSFFKVGRTKIVDNELQYQCVDLNIQKSKNDAFRMMVTKEASGENTTIAKKRAAAIAFRPSVSNGKVTIPSFLKLKNEKWRHQTASVTLEIPVGKSVKINEGAADAFYFSVNAAKGGVYYHWQLKGKTIKMTEDGVECLDCETEPHGVSQNTLNFENFSKLHLMGNMKVHLHYGDTYKISINKDAHHYNETLLTEQTDNLLSINYTGNEDLRINITVPNLEYLEINNVEDTWLYNFDVGFLKMKVLGKSDVHVNSLKANRLELEAFDDADITLKGSGAHLVAMFTGNARLDADRYEVKVADIKGYQDSDMKINVLDTLTKLIVDDADLDYDGEPVMIQTVKE